MSSVPLSSRAPCRDIEISSRKDSKFEIGNEKIPLPAGTDEPVSTDDPKATQKVFVDGKFRLEDLPPGVVPLPRIEGYEILEVLGRGGMGVVYKARETKLQRIVALKMILAGAHASPRDLQRFQTEARAVAKLQHPNIVQIHDINQQDGQNYFSLEYIDGGNLARQIDSRPQPPDQAARMVELLARAMYYAHEHHIVHRDLKPGNILMTTDGTPKITDFGVAKQLDSEQGNTRSGAIVGTPIYMAPEQARGESKRMGPASDIYSLGVILYEMLTGRPPFKGDAPIDILFQIAQDEPVPPSRLQPKIPRDLEIICLKCLEKDPNRRYLTAQALANDLARFLADEPILARPLSSFERGWRWMKRHKAITAVAAGVLLALAGIGAGLFQSSTIERRRVADRQNDLRALIPEARMMLQNDKAWEETGQLIGKIRETIRTDLALETIRAELEKDVTPLENRYAGRVFHRQLGLAHDQLMTRAILEIGEYSKNPKRMEELRIEAWKALALAGFSADKKGNRIDSFDLTPQEKQDVQRNCCELLLMLTETQSAKQALAVLDLAGPLLVKSATYHLRRARFLTEDGQIQVAEEERQKAQQIPLTAFDHFLAAEEALLKRGNDETAMAEFLQALQLQPDHFWARYYLAVSYLRTGRPDLARDNLTACVKEKPGIIWTYLMRGYAQGKLGQFAAAEQDFDTVLSMAPNDATTLYALYNNRGVMRIEEKDRLSRRGQNEEAALKLALGLRDLQQAAQQCPSKYNAFASLADAYAQQKNWNEALRNIDLALANTDDPGTKATLYRYRARYHSESKDDSAALADLGKEIELESAAGLPSAKAYVLRGQLQKKAGQFEEALTSFAAAQKIQPGWAEAIRGRSEILYEKKKYPEAVQALSSIAQMTAQDFKARGLAKSMSGDPQGAAEDYSRALELENKTADSATKTANLVWLLTHRGQAYLSCQADRPALHDFDEVLRSESKNREALGGRGLARVRLGQTDAGIQDARKSLSLASPTARICYNAGRVYAQAVAAIDVHEPKNRPISDKKFEYQNRAVDLVRQALQLLPESQRSIFWQDTVAKDACLASIHRMPAFSRLEDKHASKISAGLAKSAAK